MNDLFMSSRMWKLQKVKVYNIAMNRILKLLNSRRFAIYLLLILLAALTLSTFLPSEITVTEEKWLSIQEEKPSVYWLARNFSTPYLVRHPLFLIVALFLFLSTLTCTLNRLNRWIQTRKLEFEKEKAFSFAVDETVAEPPDPSKRKLLSSLHISIVKEYKYGYLVKEYKTFSLSSGQEYLGRCL